MTTFFLALANMIYIFMAYGMEMNQMGLSTITEAFILLGYLLERVFLKKRRKQSQKREKNRRTKKMAPTTRKKHVTLACNE